MEALAALGVAAASVQFLDFALQALALCRQIRDDAQGATATNKELESYSRSIKGLSQELEAGQADNASGRRIKAVGQACIAKTEEILILLEKVREAGSNSRTATAKTLFRSLKGGRTIEKLQNELKEKQTLLDSALIHDIQRRVDLSTLKQDENFTSFKQSIQDLVNRLSDQNAITQQNNAEMRQNHAETQGKLIDLARDNQALRATTIQGFENLKLSDAKEQLLRSLFYPEHAARREMVKPPWSDTFDWVFDETFESTTFWSSFPTWLKCGSSLYWITGKPASGKSTLMAHIFHDERTADYLQQWSGGGTLHILSFFFWRPGSPLQKSISGLLRSLVMQLADAVPEVAPAILGGLHLRPGRMPTWSERGLTDALRLALAAAKNACLCFFMDGLDEFDGPYGELVDLILEMKDSKNVKFCVSSRREAGLANRLCQYDHLSMEDLNSDAIRTYTQDKLSLVTDAEAFSHEIASRSEGVFLWAVMTTQSLVYGAVDCSEDVDMLHRRLESTPDEMTQLFSQILATVDKAHKEHLYIWIRLLSFQVRPTVAELAVMLMPDCITTYAALSAACEQIKNHVHCFSKGLLGVQYGNEWRPYDETDGLWHVPEMTGGSKVITSRHLKKYKTHLITSRTIGEPDQATEKVFEASRSRMQFLHRSVLDFVADNSLRSVLGLGDLPRDLDIMLNYFQACLGTIAVCPSAEAYAGGFNAWHFACRFMDGLSRSSDLLGTTTRSLLDELLTLVCTFSDRELHLSRRLRVQDSFPQMSPELQCLTTVEQSFFYNCAIRGLFEYVRGNMHRFFDKDDEGYCMARLTRVLQVNHASNPDSLKLSLLLLQRLRDQLNSKRMTSDLSEPRRLFWKRYLDISHSNWLMLRIAFCNREAKKNIPLSLATTTELWNGYNRLIGSCSNLLLRHDILLLYVEIMSIWEVEIGVELFCSYNHRLVLFVSPSAFLLPLGKPYNESARQPNKGWSTLQRSMYFGWQNPLGSDGDGICSHEVPEAVADEILKRWIDDRAIWEDDLHGRYDHGPSSAHISDQNIDALTENVWASEVIDSWQQLYLLALLRKWRRRRGRDDEQVPRNRSSSGSEMSYEFSSPELFSEDGER